MAKKEQPKMPRNVVLAVSKIAQEKYPIDKTLALGMKNPKNVLAVECRVAYIEGYYDRYLQNVLS